MLRMLFLVLVTAISQSAYANGDDWVRLGQKAKPQSPKVEQQRMEPKPSVPKKETEQERMRHDVEKQKQLYEHEGQYRKGL